MKLYIGFLLGCFFAGALRRTRWVHTKPLLVLAITAVIAASFYSLRVIG